MLMLMLMMTMTDADDSDSDIGGDAMPSHVDSGRLLML